MDVDIRDVRRTVQYSIPIGEQPASQRGGRACRDKMDGEMIILLPEWVQGDRSPKISKRGQVHVDNGSQTEEGAQKSEKLTDKDRRDRLSDFWYHLGNFRTRIACNVPAQPVYGFFR